MAYDTVKTEHIEYKKNLPYWIKIRKVLSGKKEEVKEYLRNVGKMESDRTAANNRQSDYEDGAVFYNFCGRTHAGMIGGVFRKPAQIELPSVTEYLKENSDGNGTTLINLARRVMAEDLALARCGLLLDAQPLPEGVVDTLANPNLPGIKYYQPESIINWRTESSGAGQRLTLVVLKEEYSYPMSADDRYTWLTGELYRVLYLDDAGYYAQDVIKFPATGDQRNTAVITDLGRAITVRGQRINYIPFQFVGASDNNSEIDDSPLLTLVDLNIGHFRNSADNEESSFIVGQPTLFVSPTLTAQQFTALHPKGILMGSRKGYNLGQGGSAMLLQASENNLAKQNMRDKEEQAIQIGASLISPSSNITAESARIQKASDTSVISAVADNVSEAITQVVQWATTWLGGDETEVDFRLNTEFFMSQMTAQDRTAWVADINAGLLPATAYYAALRRSGQLDMSDDEIEEELLKQADNMGDLPGATTNEQGTNNQTDQSRNSDNASGNGSGATDSEISQ